MGQGKKTELIKESNGKEKEEKQGRKEKRRDEKKKGI